MNRRLWVLTFLSLEAVSLLALITFRSVSAQGNNKCINMRPCCHTWAKQSGACSWQFMRLNCAAACGYCTPEVDLETNCQDLYLNCAFWATRGECNNNQNWMIENCRASCGLCEIHRSNGCAAEPPRNACFNEHRCCESWAQSQECSTYDAAELQFCSAACGQCQVEEPSVTHCQDSFVLCAPWARAGECINNPFWMEENCRQSCGLCSQDKAAGCARMMLNEPMARPPSTAPNHDQGNDPNESGCVGNRILERVCRTECEIVCVTGGIGQSCPLAESNDVNFDTDQCRQECVCPAGTIADMRQGHSGCIDIDDCLHETGAIVGKKL